MDVADLAQRAQQAWFRNLAAGGFAQISVGNGFAVSTGPDSNADNGAVITPSILSSPGELDLLLDWLRAKVVPASVLLSAPPQPELTARLIDQGLLPDRTGNTMGRLLNGIGAAAAPVSVPRWRISEITGHRELRSNLLVYAGDGWWDEADLDRRVERPQPGTALNGLCSSRHRTATGSTVLSGSCRRRPCRTAASV